MLQKEYRKYWGKMLSNSNYLIYMLLCSPIVHWRLMFDLNCFHFTLTHLSIHLQYIHICAKSIHTWPIFQSFLRLFLEKVFFSLIHISTSTQHEFEVKKSFRILIPYTLLYNDWNVDKTFYFLSIYYVQ